jgi:hypothetical protein
MTLIRSSYKWQTNINNDDGKTRVDISRADHFVDKVHEAGHVLNPLRPFQPRLTDGFICVVYWILRQTYSTNDCHLEQLLVTSCHR